MLASTVVPISIAFAVFLGVAALSSTAVAVLYYTLLSALLITAAFIALECARATRFPEPPRGELAEENLPTVATVIAAYLPNEHAGIIDSVRAHLSVDYPHEKHLVVLAYNRDDALRVEDDLARMAALDARFVALHVEGSTSKVDNLNAAIEYLSDDDGNATVDVVGIFDADHHPDPSALRRAARWLTSGSEGASAERPGLFDMVQGQCLIRNVDASFWTRTVAVEFATIYAVAHPGRTVFNDFGIFGGSNGWWRAQALADLRFDPDMLTEDIDITMRALEAGLRLGTDPRIVSTEMAPSTLRSLWSQRSRWAQGWHEVTLRHAHRLLRAPGLTPAHRRGVVLLTYWRALHPWLALLPIPLVIAQAMVNSREVKPFLLMFVITTLLTNGIPLIQSLTAQRVAPPAIGARKALFARWAVVTVLFYAEFKSVVARAAVLRDALRHHAWDITSRDYASDPDHITAAEPAAAPITAEAI